VTSAIFGKLGATIFGAVCLAAALVVLFVEGALPSASRAQKAALIATIAPKLRLTFSHEVINFIGGHLWFVAGGLKMNDPDALVRLPFRAGTRQSFKPAEKSARLEAIFARSSPTQQVFSQMQKSYRLITC
jgi:hypothetical protein